MAKMNLWRKLLYDEGYSKMPFQNADGYHNKTISKYYYRLYRKAKTISNDAFMTPKGNRISCKNLYDQYSIKGATKNGGNFISYVYRANKAYNGTEPIDRSTKNHMFKIGKALNKPPKKKFE